MTETPPGPAAWARTELGDDAFSLTAEPSPNSPAAIEKQEALTALRRDFEAESACLNAARAARAAATKLNHCADDLGLGLFREADQAFEAGRQFAKEATRHLTRMRAALDGDARGEEAAG